MSGYVDLHCHYLPGIDDGVRTLEDGVALCRGLKSIGYERVVATPHIRTVMFENTKLGLEQAMRAFETSTADLEGMPALGLGAEHFFDDVFWGLFEQGLIVPYPGKHAALVEFPRERLPFSVERFLFEMNVQGTRPVLAHPERYRPFFHDSADLQPILQVEVLLLMDVMSLVGRYGRKPQAAAERLLHEGAYYAACSDCHRPKDVEIVQKAIERLQELTGPESAQTLLSTNPQHILNGTALA